MHPTVFAIADEVLKGKLEGSYDLMGVHQRRAVPAFPASVHVAVLIDLTVTEADRVPDNRLTVHVIKPDDTELAHVFSPAIDLSPKPQHGESRAARTLQPIRMTVNFPEPGTYRFEMRHNGVTWARIPYQVVLGGTSEG